jgi:dihydroxyacetone kinase-like predicted kinase
MPQRKAIRNLKADQIKTELAEKGIELRAANDNTVVEEAAETYKEADVRVLECKTIGEGYAALTMIDLSQENPDDVMECLREAMDGVKTGMVTHAVRDAQMNGVTVKEGEFIGI